MLLKEWNTTLQRFIYDTTKSGISKQVDPVQANPFLFCLHKDEVDEIPRTSDYI